jgi:UDP-4-amino-4,6-dideoxy-N-acetyl-beta-L-altrosamine transaminase
MDYIPYGRQAIDEDDIHAVVEVLKGEYLTTGPCVPAFEEAICNYAGCRYATAVNSGTSALDLAVQVLDLPIGSEIITSPLTFAATSNAVLYHNLIPVFADVEKESRNIDPDQVRKKITPKTKAIITVDYAGHPCRVDEIQEIADENGLYLIEDACHALGASYGKKKIGTLADMTIFSFHPVKPITTGEGGAIVTDNEELDRKLHLLRTHGIDRTKGRYIDSGAGWAYDMVDLGRNYRMTDIHAALGRSQIKKLDQFIKIRNDLAKRYHSLLDGNPFIEVPVTRENVVHGWHLYTILLTGIDRNRLFLELRKKNIGVNVHYIPVYKLKYYRERIPTIDDEYPVTEDIFKRIITLPLHPLLTQNDQEFVAECVINACNEYGQSEP